MNKEELEKMIKDINNPKYHNFIEREFNEYLHYSLVFPELYEYEYISNIKVNSGGKSLDIVSNRENYRPSQRQMLLLWFTDKEECKKLFTRGKTTAEKDYS